MNNQSTGICYQHGKFKAASSTIDIMDIGFLKEDGILKLANAASRFGRKQQEYEIYFKQQQENKSLVIMVLNIKNALIMGYAVLLWTARFRALEIKSSPEIMDIFVFPEFRKMGVAKLLIEFAENLTKQAGLNTIGLGVRSNPKYVHVLEIYTKLYYRFVGNESLPEGDIIVLEKIIQ